MNVIFMGTPEFSVPTLEKLYSNGYNIQLVVTQPDKPSGRGKKIKKSEVKEKAEELGLNVFQPQKVKSKDAVEILKTYNTDVIVVVAYGQLLSKEILDMPKYGCVNVHASLLPELRGAAPLNWAIVNGNKTSGVTTMMMDVGLDTGDMLLSDEVSISENMNAGELHDILMEKGGDLLIQTLRAIENNSAVRIKQDDLKSSYAPMLNKEMAAINWNDTAQTVHNKIRGLYPWPCAYFKLDDKNVKVYKSEIMQSDCSAERIGSFDAFDELFEAECSKAEPGTVVKVNDTGIYVKAKDGIVIIKEIQMPGKNKMTVETYLRGNIFPKHIKL